MIATSTNSFSTRITRESALVYDLRFHLHDLTAWYIFQADRTKHEAFKKAFAATGSIKLEEYGKILHFGWDEPPEELKAELNRKYRLYNDS